MTYWLILTPSGVQEFYVTNATVLKVMGSHQIKITSSVYSSCEFHCSFVLCRRKKVIKCWNDMRARKSFSFGVNGLFKALVRHD